MIKTSMMFSAHTLHVFHVVLRDTLIVLIVLFIALFTWLKYGIHTERFTLGKFVVEGLYIKLDKKLTFQAEKIVIPESKEKPSFDNVDKTFDRIKDLLTYFEYIELSEIDFNNNKLKLLFTDNILYVTSDDYEVAGNIERKGSTLVADVSLFYIKKAKVNIVGKLKYFLNKDRLETEGSFEGYNINGNFAAFKEKDLISFALKSGKFHDLKTITDTLPLNETVKSWMAEKISAKEYKLHSFVGKAHVVDRTLEIDVPSLRGEAILNEVKIYYHNGLEPILAKEVKLLYKNRSLYFDLEEPIYKARSLQGSRVSITNMKVGEISELNLDLHIKSEIDEVVHDVLKAYKLHIPITQKGNVVNADINMTIPLGHGKKKNVKVKTKTDISLTLSQGEVIINKNLKLSVKGGKIYFSNGVIQLKDIQLKDQWYEAIVNGKVNVKKKKANLEVQVDHIVINENKESYFTLKNKKMAVKIDYEKYTVEIPALALKILKKENAFNLKLMDIKKIKPYLKKIPIQMDGGYFNIHTEDLKIFTYTGVIKRNACFFYDKGNICHTQIPCSGVVSSKKSLFTAFNNRLKIDILKGMITVNRLNIDLQELMKNRDKDKKAKKKGRKITINGKKSNLRYKKYILVTDKYRINISEKGNINALGFLNGDKVKLVKMGKKLTIEALRIKDQLLHPLINFKGLKNGRYTLKAYGIPNKLMHGEIIIEGGVLSDFTAYNNTLAFINTLPALATLHSPGFSKKGFVIKKGVAKYRKIGEKIIFDTIQIEGTSANFVGQGEIDLKKNTININMAIQTAREFGKVVGSIPLLGYILMGEDKSMTVGLKITGSLSKPKVETSATQELLKLPLDILVRTLKSPAHIENKKPKVKQKNIKPKAPKIFNQIAP